MGEGSPACFERVDPENGKGVAVEAWGEASFGIRMISLTPYLLDSNIF